MRDGNGRRRERGSVDPAKGRNRGRARNRGPGGGRRSEEADRRRRVGRRGCRTEPACIVDTECTIERHAAEDGLGAEEGDADRAETGDERTEEDGVHSQEGDVDRAQAGRLGPQEGDAHRTEGHDIRAQEDRAHAQKDDADAEEGDDLCAQEDGRDQEEGDDGAEKGDDLCAQEGGRDEEKGDDDPEKGDDICAQAHDRDAEAGCLVGAEAHELGAEAHDVGSEEALSDGSRLPGRPRTAHRVGSRPVELVDALAGTTIGATYNQYAGSQLRRERLRAYLAARVDAELLLVGEAAGYRGARVSGIPFTSERQLTGRGPAEASATIVHRVLDGLGIAAQTLLWNVVPTHPGTETSNRRPTRREIDASRPFLEELAAGRTVIAVGRIAAADLDAPYVRHPSHGGAQAFAEGLREALAAARFRYNPRPADAWSASFL